MPENETQNTSAQEIKGVYTISDIDKFNIAHIETVKTNYLLNLSTFDPEESREQLLDLLSIMQMYLEKYFSVDQINKQTVNIAGKLYTFYDLKNVAESVAENTIMRLVAQNAFNIYNHFAKIIGVEIPTTKSNPKKRSPRPSLFPNTQQK